MTLRSVVVTLLLVLAFMAAFLGPLLVANAFGKCRTQKCWHRVSVARHESYAWRQYHRNPMPRCTWVNESGAEHRGFGEWSRARYRVLNQSGSDAGGKFQIIYRTWLAYGGKPYGNARYAPPLEQEKIARRILSGQGIGAWMGCR